MGSGKWDPVNGISNTTSLREMQLLKWDPMSKNKAAMLFSKWDLINKDTGSDAINEIGAAHYSK